MAVLAASAAERDRYRRTLSRCYRDGELMPLASLLDLTAPPADRVTGFLVESASVVEWHDRHGPIGGDRENSDAVANLYRGRQNGSFVQASAGTSA